MPATTRRNASTAQRRDAALHDYSFGIEEEYFLVRIGTGELVREMPPALMQRLRERFAGLIGTELLQSQVEARTPVCRHPDDAWMVLGNLRRGLNEEAMPHGLAILSAGTHPTADWRTLRADPAPRHAGLVADFALIARRNAVCGLHVHVSPPPGVDRVGVMNGVVPWTPLLLALSASSPFWTGELTGLASYRQAAYDEWPRSGTPPDLRDEREYERLVERLKACGSIADARSIWWTMRPSCRYPTLELRISDACTDLDDALCIAQLFRCLVRAASRGDTLFPPAYDRVLVEEDRWQAKRHGIRAQLMHPLARRPRPLAEVLDDLLSALAPHADALDCRHEVEHARRIVAGNGSAARQLECYAQARADGAAHELALERVIEHLVGRTEGVRHASPAASARVRAEAGLA